MVTLGCCGVGELGDFSPIPTRHATANSLGSVVRAVAAGDVVSGPGDHACCIRGEEDDDRSHVVGLDPWDAKRTLFAESDTRLLLIFLDPAGGRFATDFECLRIAFFMPGERCINEAGAERVHGDAVLAEFERGGLHQADDAPLRRRVGSAKLCSVLALRGCRQDDAAAASLHDQRCEGADRVCRSGQIHINLNVPVGILQLQKRTKCLDAGVGKEYVKAAEAVLYFRCDIAQRGQVSLIGHERDPAPAGRLDKFSCVIKLVSRRWSDARAGIDDGADIDACNVSTVLRKGDGNRAANATSRTGDDSYFALKGWEYLFSGRHGKAPPSSDDSKDTAGTHCSAKGCSLRY